MLLREWSHIERVENESPSGHIQFPTAITRIAVVWFLGSGLTFGMYLPDHQDFLVQYRRVGCNLYGINIEHIIL